MREAIFSVPGLDEGNALDLDTALTGMSGVAGVTTDDAAHTLTVEYDPDFVDQEAIAHAIMGAGYPLGSRHQ